MERPQSDFSPIETMMMQRVAFYALHRSMDLGLFDSIEAAGGMSVAALADAHGLHLSRTEALLDMLAVAGAVERTGDVYRNTPLASEHMVGASPFFQGQALALHVRFNETVEEHFDDLLRGDADARKFSDDGWGIEDVMLGTSQHARMGTLQDTVAFVAALPGFEDMRVMADIGGNHGEFSMALLDRNPALRGEIVDLPHVVPAATRRIGERGYEGRLAAVARDLRTERLSPGAYDLVLASHVLYGFVEAVDDLLADVFRSLRPGGWFVAQHSAPGGSATRGYDAVVEFVTRMAGYGSHHIDGPWLSDKLVKAGFSSPETASAGGSGLLVAARKA